MRGAGRIAAAIALLGSGCAALTAPDPKPLPDGGFVTGGTTTTPIVDPPPPVMELPNELRPPFAGEVNPRWVAEFSGGSPGPHIDHGRFWPDSKLLGNTWWEAWVMPLPNHGGYFVSDGYGGGHAILIGTALNGTISGNMWAGPDGGGYSGAYSTMALDAFAVGEWFHVAVGYERTQLHAIVVYINGILSGYVPRTQDRWSMPPGTGAGELYIGGSNHQNFGGRIAWIRAFDRDVFPRDPASFMSAFRPRRDPLATERGPGVINGEFVADGEFNADFLASYRVPAATTIVPDLATVGARLNPPPRMTAYHPGKPEFSLPSGSGPTPKFVEDPTAPFGPGPQPPRTQIEVKPRKTPYAALVYDSFARANQDFTSEAEPVLGQTEGGELGTLPWQTLPGQPFGIRNSYAIFLGSKNLSPVWVESGISDVDIQIQHRGTAGFSLTGGGAIVFRMSDPENLWMAIVSAPLTVTLRKIVNGQATDVGVYPLPPTWYGMLDARAVGDTIEVIADLADGTVAQIASVTDDFNSKATKVGFASAAGSYTRIESFALLKHKR